MPRVIRKRRLMRNYVEIERRGFIGESANGVGNWRNTKRPGAKLFFFTRPTRVQDVGPEAGCDVKVGFNNRSHNLMSGVVRGPSHDATSESVGGRRAKLLNGFGVEHQWQAGLQLPFRATPIESPATRQCKPVSPAKRFYQGWIVGS